MEDVVKVAWRSRMGTKLHSRGPERSSPQRDFQVGEMLHFYHSEDKNKKVFESTGLFHLLEVLEGTDCFYMKTSFRALHSSFRSRHRSSERRSMQSI